MHQEGSPNKQEDIASASVGSSSTVVFGGDVDSDSSSSNSSSPSTCRRPNMNPTSNQTSLHSKQPNSKHRDSCNIASNTNSTSAHKEPIQQTCNKHSSSHEQGCNLCGATKCQHSRALSCPLVSSDVFLNNETSVPSYGRVSILPPTRLPILMTRSASAAGRSLSQTMQRDPNPSFSTNLKDAATCGSHERLATSSETAAPLDVSKKLLYRCITSKSSHLCQYSKRSLLVPLMRYPHEKRIHRAPAMRPPAPRQTFSSHDIKESTNDNIVTKLMSTSCFADCAHGPVRVQYVTNDQHSVQGSISLPDENQTSSAKVDSVRSTSSSRSLSPRKKPITNEVLPRRTQRLPYWLDATRHSLYSNDSGVVSEGSLDEWDRSPQYEWTAKYGHNVGGGIISPPVERLVALWRSDASRCHMCRNDGRLRRTRQRRRGTTKIAKPKVIRRDRCICERYTNVRKCRFVSNNKRPASSLLSKFTDRITLAYIIIVIAFLLRLFELFIFEHRSQ